MNEINKELLDEQKLAIKGLNVCIGGEDSLTTNNLRACGEYLDNEKCLLEMVRELQAREKVLVEALKSAKPVYATAKNTKAVKTGHELGGYVKDYLVSPHILHNALANVRGD